MRGKEGGKRKPKENGQRKRRKRRRKQRRQNSARTSVRKNIFLSGRRGFFVDVSSEVIALIPLPTSLLKMISAAMDNITQKCSGR